MEIKEFIEKGAALTTGLPAEELSTILAATYEILQSNAALTQPQFKDALTDVRGVEGKTAKDFCKQVDVKQLVRLLQHKAQDVITDYDNAEEVLKELSDKNYVYMGGGNWYDALHGHYLMSGEFPHLRKKTYKGERMIKSIKYTTAIPCEIDGANDEHIMDTQLEKYRIWNRGNAYSDYVTTDKRPYGEFLSDGRLLFNLYKPETWNYDLLRCNDDVAEDDMQQAEFLHSLLAERFSETLKPYSTTEMVNGFDVLLTMWRHQYNKPEDRWHKLIIIKGDGGTGKGTIDTLCRSIFGKHFVTTTIGELSNNFNMQLTSSLIISISEADALSHETYTRLKHISGTDVMQYTSKGKDSIQGLFRGMVFISSNNVNLLNYNDTAVQRRLIELDMKTEFSSNYCLNHPEEGAEVKKKNNILHKLIADKDVVTAFVKRYIALDIAEDEEYREYTTLTQDELTANIIASSNVGLTTVLSNWADSNIKTDLIQNKQVILWSSAKYDTFEHNCSVEAALKYAKEELKGDLKQTSIKGIAQALKIMCLSKGWTMSGSQHNRNGNFYTISIS
jgi:PIN domain nuclease of toxin-antitoxin system